jgi:2-polyprenylphenol 6-hydroxylase
MANNQAQDVVIVGAGIVGLTFALTLAKAGMQVTLLEEKPIKLKKAIHPMDLRVSAITLGSVLNFKRLNIWDAIAAVRVSPFLSIEVWQESNDSRLHFHSSDVHQAQLGFIVENSLIQQVLFEAIQQQENINYLAPITLAGFTVENNALEISLSDGQLIYTKLLVGADGINSTVRRCGNFEMHEKDYAQSALIAMVHTRLPHQQIAHQRFLTSGPLAFLPLADANHCSIVWSHQPQQAQELMDMPAVEFNTSLQSAFGSKLGEVRVVTERKVFPLSKRHVKNYVQPRVALIGDAAHTIHPMAGQGLNMGIQDAVTLADIIINAQQQKRDIGLLPTLRRYERARKTANQIMLSVVDGFHFLFRQQKLPLSLLRNLGFHFTERCLPLKKMIIERAMGL